METNSREEQKKVYFNPGDVVKLKQSTHLDYTPNMIVKRRVKNTIFLNKFIHQPTTPESISGIECFWFDKNLCPHSSIFNFKDLILIKEAKNIN